MSHSQKLFTVLSPDGFSIYHDFKPQPRKEAENDLRLWIERYRQQGYYSTSNRTIIELDDIFDSCRFIEVSQEEIEEFNNEH